MSAATSWLPDVDHRIIEFGVPDDSIATHLHERGRERYLGLTLPEVTISSDDHLATRFHPLASVGELRASNADVVILHGDLASVLWYRHVGRASYALVPPERAWEVRLAGRLHRRPVPSSVELAGRPFLLVRLHDMPWLGARRYASPVTGVAGLPGELDRREIDYVVLRWFEHLPHIEPGEDLDVLVADDDVDTLVDTLEHEPGTIPVDVYTVSGLPGFDFASIAYYPPTIAAGILDRSTVTAAGFSVPAPRDHFLSLAFHAVYHKGYSSGLTSIHHGRADASIDHPYARILTDLGRAQGYRGPITLEHLDEHLAACGWQPPHDALSKLSHVNGWVRDHHFGAPDAVEPPELAVYLLRERAVEDEQHITAAEHVLASNGFDVLHSCAIAGDERAQCATGVRGGNWGAGPFARSGGLPAWAIVAAHDSPRPPDAAEARQHPALTNALVYRSKLEIRQFLLSGVDDELHYNPLHSSDNDAEAWHYLELAAPHLVDDVTRYVEQRRRELRSQPTASSRSRSRVNVPDTRQLWHTARPGLGRAKRTAKGAIATIVRRAIDRRSTPASLGYP